MYSYYVQLLCTAVVLIMVLVSIVLVPVEPVVQLYRTAVGSMLVDTSTIHFSVSCTGTAVTGGPLLVLLIWMATCTGLYREVFASMICMHA